MKLIGRPVPDYIVICNFQDGGFLGVIRHPTQENIALKSQLVLRMRWRWGKYCRTDRQTDKPTDRHVDWQ